MQRVAVVVFPGSNCDADTLDAAHAAGSDAYYVWHRDTDLKQADAVILPGGFSYGDYLRSGAIARFSPVMRAGKHLVLQVQAGTREEAADNAGKMCDGLLANAVTEDYQCSVSQ